MMSQATTKSSLYCLPVTRHDDRFIADRGSSLAFSDLIQYSDLKDYLAESYNLLDAVVEIAGVVHVAQVFEASDPQDSSYVLVDAEGKPSSPPTLFHLLGEAFSEYFSNVRKALAFSDSFPPSHRSYLLTEFVEPRFRVLEGASSALNMLSWNDARQVTRAIIQGEPGIGKTTCLRMLALEETKRLGSDQDGRLPIFLQLRDLANASTLWETALKSLTELGHDIEAESVLRSGRVLLLLDGLDEVAPERRSSLVEQIGLLAAHWPLVGFLVTTRSSTAPAGLPGFARLQVEPFDETRQDEWIRRRIRRVSSKAATDVLSILRASRSIGSLAGNPLLLAIAAAYVERTGVAPTRPSSLVIRYIDALVEDWDEAKGVIRWSSMPLSKQRKLEILCRTAFHTCRANKGSFLKDEFIKWEDDWCEREISTTALTTLWEHSGIVQPTSGNKAAWRFAHSMLEDVLAARYIIERPDNIFTTIADEVEAERLGRLWRHACVLTQDATPLMRFMLGKAGVDDGLRALLIAQTLLDDVSIPRDVVTECATFVTDVISSLGAKLEILRTDQDEKHWFMEAAWTASEGSKVGELKVISTLLRTLLSGVATSNRGRLAERLRSRGGTIGAAIADQTERGGSVSETLDGSAGRVRFTSEEL